MKNTYTLTLFLLSLLTWAQDGTRVYEFVNITTSPRQAALGGNVQSAWDSDPNMALWNPALMNEEMHGQLALNYINYLADVSFGTISGIYKIDEKNYLSAHGQYVDYGSFKSADVNGNITGNFIAKDAAITIGYAHNLSDFFTVGVNAKYINSQIESYTSSAIAGDIGLVFHDIDYNTNIALAIRNFGFQIKEYDGKKEDLPLQINLGISHKLEYVPLELSLTLHDLQKFNNSVPFTKNGQKVGFGRKFIDHISIGAELFPQKAFNLRVGYNFKRGNELKLEDTRAFSGLTYGFGLRISSFRFEFAHANYYKGSNSTHFGLIINLDRLIQGRNYWRSNPYR